MYTVKQYKPISNTGIQLAFENYLKTFNLDTFITITFRKRLQADTVKKLLHSFLAHINDKEIDYYKKFIYSWIFIEKNTSDCGSHVHLLVKGLDPDKYVLLEQLLKESFGYAQIKSCHDNSIPYIANKYVTNRLLDYQPMRINSKRRKRFNDNAPTASVSNEALAINSV